MYKPSRPKMSTKDTLFERALKARSEMYVASIPNDIHRLQNSHATYCRTYEKRLDTPLFALIIGINDYKGYPLKGAVPDADAIFIFLTTQLLVPHSNIVNLRNANATRARIISELESLACRDGIPQHAAILIYFAGHGCANDIPTDWEGYHTANGKVESICPVDIFAQDPETGVTISGIPDQVVSCLIHEISAAHGNNVVSLVRLVPDFLP